MILRYQYDIIYSYDIAIIQLDTANFKEMSMLYIPDSKEFIISKNFIDASTRYVPESGPLHYHRYMELEIIVKGSGINTQNGMPSQLKTGCAMLLTPSDFHQITIHEPCTVCNLAFNENILSPKLLNQVYKFKNANSYIHLDKKALNEAQTLFNILEQNCDKKIDVALKNYLLCVLEALINLALANIKEFDKENSVAPSAFEEIIIYLYKHFRENPRLDDVSALVNMNPSYVSRNFKQKFGISYIEFLTRLKLNYAKNMLSVSDNSITDICYASGFNSISNFMESFKKYTQSTPAQYRATYKSNIK